MRPVPHKLRRLFDVMTLACAIVACCSLLGGCTTVKIRNATVTEASYFGMVVLRISPDRDVMSIVTTRGIGLTFGARSTTLGFLSESVFLAPDGGACRAFFLVFNGVDEIALRRLLDKQPQLSQICVITAENP